jgi:hypothetical protein
MVNGMSLAKRLMDFGVDVDTALDLAAHGVTIESIDDGDDTGLFDDPTEVDLDDNEEPLG